MPNKRLQEVNNEYQDEGGEVEPTHHRQNAPDGAQCRFCDAVTEITDHAHQFVVGVNYIEGDQPAKDGADDQNPDIEVEQAVEQLESGREKGVSNVHGILGRGGVACIFIIENGGLRNIEWKVPEFCDMYRPLLTF
jgi:hypothetical protein